MSTDISKCSNDECSLKENCLRWTIKPGEYQSYTRFEPAKYSCGFQIKIQDESKLKKLIEKVL